MKKKFIFAMLVLFIIFGCTNKNAQNQPPGGSSGGMAVQDPEIQGINNDMNSLDSVDNSDIENIDSELENVNW